jgi:hypothetical protein
VKVRHRILVALVLAALVVALGGAVSLVGGARRSQLDAELGAAPPAPGMEGPRADPPERGPPPSTAAPQEAPRPPAPEPLIEELLAEHGEDPGAVYYTSRVREALREGNPAFARELLRQMKEQHPQSVLVEEAEALFEGR